MDVAGGASGRMLASVGRRPSQDSTREHPCCDVAEEELAKAVLSEDSLGKAAAAVVVRRSGASGGEWDERQWWRHWHGGIGSVVADTVSLAL